MDSKNIGRKLIQMHIARQDGMREKDSIPVAEFREFFRNLPGLKLGLYWNEYKTWHKKQLPDEFSRFNEYMESQLQIPETFDIRFPNAKKGASYECRIQFPDNILLCKFIGFESLNLKPEKIQQSPLTYKISGVPETSGDYIIKILMLPSICLKLPRENRAPYIIKRKLPFTVNPDPRELWKNIPTPKDLEYYKPEADSTSLVCGPSHMFGASVRGRSHAHGGLPRDDDFGLDCVDGWRILVVADGAGSARYSRQGSRIACKIALETCRQSLQENNELDRILEGLQNDEMWQQKAKGIAYKILPQAFFNVYKAIENEARIKQREPREYATTLLFAMTKKFPSGWIVISFQIGDGAMAMFYDTGKVALLAEPDEGEFGGQTRFVTMKEMFKDGSTLIARLRIDLVSRLDALILMTDGVSDAKFETLANLRNSAYWSNLYNEIIPVINSMDHEAALIEWLGFWSPGNHDDRTMAILRNDIPRLGQFNPYTSSLPATIKQ